MVTTPIPELVGSEGVWREDCGSEVVEEWREVLGMLSREVLLEVFKREVLGEFRKEDCGREVVEVIGVSDDETVTWEGTVVLTVVGRKLVWLLEETAAIFC